MTDGVLDQQLARMRAAYASSALARFFEWWSGELRPLVPPRLRAWFADVRKEALISVDAAAIEVRRTGVRAREPQRFERAADSDSLAAELKRALVDVEEPPALILLLPAARVLRRVIVLPQAAESNLRQVLAFEMDRQTPFKADQVYFDQRVIERLPASRQLRVEFALAPRPSIDADVAALGALGLPLAGVDLATDDGRPRAGFNLLPPERRAQRRDPWVWIALGLGLLCVMLLFAAMWQSVINREAALDALRAEVDRAGVEARSVTDLRSELGVAVEGASFLAEQKRTQPGVSDLLLDLTRRLPVDTSLQRFAVVGDEVTIQGLSREAAGLIGILRQSQMVSGPSIVGAVSPDQASGKEQFQIEAQARTRNAPALEAQPKPTTDAATNPTAAARSARSRADG